MQWLNFMLAETNVPQTVSVSYGDDEQSVSEEWNIKEIGIDIQQ